MSDEHERSEAIGELEEYLKEHPDSDRFAELAELMLAEERFEETLTLCERGIGYHPDLAAGHLLYGKALLKIGKLEEGNQAFKRACGLRINDVGIYCEVGQYLVDQDLAEAAYPYLKKGLELDPGDPRIIRLEANIQGQTDSDDARVETRPISIETERTLASPPKQGPAAGDSDGWRVPTERLDWEDIEGQPLPDIRPPPDGEPETGETLTDLATDDDEDYEPPTLYTTNPLQANHGGENEDEARTLLTRPVSDESELEEHTESEPELIDLPEDDEFAFNPTDRLEVDPPSGPPSTQPDPGDREETIMDPSAGLRAEVSDALDRAVKAEPANPPTILNPGEQGPQPWSWAPSGPPPSTPGEPPTMLEGEQEKRKAAQPTRPKEVPSGEFQELSSSRIEESFATPTETFSYMKVFLVLVPFLVAGLGLGGYVAFRHIRADKITSLLDRSMADIGLDTFHGYAQARVTLQGLLELEEEHTRGKTLLALASSRIHQEYGPSLAHRDEAKGIVEHPPQAKEGETAHPVDLLWARFHLLLEPLSEPDDYDATRWSNDPGLSNLATRLEKAQEAADPDPLLVALAGELAAVRGELEKSKSLLQQSLSTSPSRVRTLYALARLDLASGNRKIAKTHLEKLLAINLVHTKSLILLSRLRLEEKKDLLKVKVDLAKVLELTKVTGRRRAEAMLLSAHLAFEQSERSSALKAIDEAAGLLAEDAGFLARLARLCRRYYELSKAAELADKALALNPDDILIKLLRIGSNLPRSREAEVLRALDELAGKKVPATPFRVLRGEALLQAGRHSGALNDLSRVPAKAAQYPKAKALSVLAWLGKDNHENAYRELSGLVAKYPKNPLVHYALGEYRLSKRLSRSATAAFNKAIEIDSRCYRALDSLAGMAYRKKKYAKAEELSGRALAANPFDTKARWLLGQLKLDKQDPLAALVHFARLVKELPKSKEGLVGMAESLLRLDRNDQALRAISMAIESGATDAHARTVEGRIHLARGKHFLAVRALKKADREKPKDAEILADLGLAQLGSRSYTNAERTFKESLKRRRLFRAQEGLANVYLKKRKYKDAAKAFEKAAFLASKKDRKPEEVAGLYMEGGQAWVKDRSSKNNYSKARRLFRRAARVIPKDPEPHFQIGAAFDRDDKLNAARVEYLKSLELDPAYPLALYRLGLLEFDVGNDTKAQDYLDRFLKTKPTGKDARRAQTLLKRIKSAD